MRQDERKSLLLLEWDHWLQTQLIDPPAPTARDTLKFFCELQDRRSPLLDFRPSAGDRWQVIHAWLLNAWTTEGNMAKKAKKSKKAKKAKNAAKKKKK